jgi:glucose-1-phosphatase
MKVRWFLINIYDQSNNFRHRGVIQGSNWQKCAEMTGTNDVDLFKKAFKDDELKFLRQYVLGKMSSDVFMSHLFPLVKSYNPNVTEYQIRRAIGRLEPPERKLIALIKKLKEDYILVILSNSWPEIESENLSHNGSDLAYLKYFEPHIYLSHHIHLRKPEKEAFEFVQKKLKLNPEEILFIDDLVHNIESAKEFGFQTILFKSVDSLINDLDKLNLIDV